MAKKKPSFAPVPLLNEAWDYLRKQPVLSMVLVWLLILPTALSSWVSRGWEARRGGAFDVIRTVEPADVLFLVLSFFFALLTLWGVGAVLLVGKRMVTSRAGRTRSSLRRVSRDSLPLVFPLLLTSLLQQIGIFYRALLFIVPALAASLWFLQDISPGIDDRVDDILPSPLLPALFILSPLLIPAILYALRTSFYPVILGCEDKAYREALRSSDSLVRGKVLRVFAALLALAAFTFLPAILLSMIITVLTPEGFSALPYAMDIIHAALSSAALLVFLLAMIGLYGRLKESAPKMRQVEAA